MQPNRFQDAEPNPKKRTYSWKPNSRRLSNTEHLQRNPTYEKGQGRPLPTRGTPLTNLTTVK